VSKKLKLPDPVAKARVLIAWIGSGDRELRDTSQPVGFDSQGNALYGPRGIVSTADTLEEALRNLPRIGSRR
jgi:hypothetical protein